MLRSDVLSRRLKRLTTSLVPCFQVMQTTRTAFGINLEHFSLRAAQNVDEFPPDPNVCHLKCINFDVCFVRRNSRSDGSPSAGPAAAEEERSRGSGSGSRFGCCPVSALVAGLPFGADDSHQSPGSLVLRPAHSARSSRCSEPRFRSN